MVVALQWFVCLEGYIRIVNKLAEESTMALLLLVRVLHLSIFPALSFFVLIARSMSPVFHF